MIAACAIALSTLAVAPANVSASSYDVAVTLTADGSFDVRERITLDAGSTPISWFEREVPDRRTDGITDVVALMDGQPLGQTGTPSARITSRRGVNVRWTFAPTVNAPHVFEIRYRALHLLVRDIDGYGVSWTALPTRHSYPIEAATVSIAAPTSTVATSLTAEGGSVMPAASGGVMIRAANLTGEHDTVTFHLTLAPTSISPVEGQWHIRLDRNAQFTPAWIFAAGTLIVVGIGILVMAMAQLRRTPLSNGAVADAAALGPAEAAVLMGKGHTGNWLALQAAFVGAVQRRQLRIADASGDGSAPQFVVTAGDGPAANPFDQWFIDVARSFGDSSALGHTARRLGRRHREFARLMADRLTALGYLDAERRRTRSGIRVTGAVVLVSSLVGAIVLAAFVPDLGEVPLVVPAAGFVVGLAYMAFPGAMTTLSPEGEAAGESWRKRAAALRHEMAHSEGLGLDVFERGLPLAVGAGFGRQWIAAFGPQLAASGSALDWLVEVGRPEHAAAALEAVFVVMHAGSASAGGVAGGAGGASAGGGSSSAG